MGHVLRSFFTGVGAVGVGVNVSSREDEGASF